MVVTVRDIVMYILDVVNDPNVVKYLRETPPSEFS